MITLNLISESLKKEIKYKHLYNLFKKIDYIILIAIIVISIMILTTKFLLTDRFNNVVQETTLINKNSFSYNTKVKDINNKINTISQIQAGFTDWPVFFADFSNNVPADISLSYLKVSQDDQSLSLKGLAKTRDGLLKLKEYLDTSKYLSNVDFPMSNLLNQADIDFEISAKINQNQLNNGQ